jgi:2-polyprenyl-3-methyl-5-hydroxy-6-metoxy-1,4-benzoquinol methylase
MVEISECPVCNGTVFQTIAQCLDNTVSHETFTVKQCTSCMLGITSPRPEEKILGSYYESQEYISHSGKSSGGIGWIYNIARFFSLRWKKNIISQFSQTGSTLDFGCGSGQFLNALQKYNWNITGVEPSEFARKKAAVLNGNTIYGSLAEIHGKEFDTITAWHVIEHVPSPLQTIQQLKSHLKKSGTIFIAVPNYQSPDAKHYKNYWAGFDVPRHLWHFSKQSMQALLEKSGLEVVKIIPMRLDAYYVSLLSEKYKAENKFSPIHYIKGIISGLASNLRASKEKNHSSLIYIARIHEV